MASRANVSPRAILATEVVSVGRDRTLRGSTVLDGDDRGDRLGDALMDEGRPDRCVAHRRPTAGGVGDAFHRSLFVVACMASFRMLSSGAFSATEAVSNGEEICRVRNSAVG
jgi:hypothetical protein